MNLFVSEIVTPPAHLPVTVAAADMALAGSVVEELERGFLWRAIVRQERRIVLDGSLPPRIEIEPVQSIESLTVWTPTDAASVIDTDTYSVVTRDPAGTIIVPNSSWPDPERSIGSFSINYECGWTVTPESAPLAGDSVNSVPAAILFMLDRAIKFRAGSGLGNISIGSLKIDVADSYSTDRLPRAITDIARAWAYRPGLFSARP